MAIIGILAEGQKESIRKSLEQEIKRLGASIETVFVENEREFASLDALVLPRGKSMRFSEIMHNTRLGRAIAKFSKTKPLLVICGSLIPCVKRLGKGCEGRKTIGIIDAKADNCCLDGNIQVILSNGRECIGNFTDAPILYGLGKKVEKLAEAKGKIVAVRGGNAFGFSFMDRTGVSYTPFLMAVIESI